MKFPSKVTSYKESSVSQFPVVLSLLEQNPMTPRELYSKFKKTKDISLQEFMDILDCLYALNKIEFREEVLYYVSSDTM